MYVPLVRWPGSAPIDGDQRTCALLYMMESHLLDAAAVLHLFWVAMGTPEARQEAFRRHGEQAQRVQHHVTRLTAQLDQAEASKEALESVELAAYECAWADEQNMPGSCERRLPRIYAHSFLYALDGILKILGQLVAIPGIRAIEEEFKAALPDVKGTRDSAHHSDERALGRAHGELIEVQPLEFFGGSTIVIGHLLGNTLAYTKADGTLGQVEIAPTTLAIARRTVQQAINAFRWTGAPRVTPSG